MQQIISIQILRGLAALAIVVLHAFHDAEFLASAQGWVFRSPDWALGAGVDLFFVISGFVMVVASKRLFATQGASYQFLGRRLARIVPIYWAATTLFLVILLARPDVLNSPVPGLGDIFRSYFFIPYLKDADGLLQPIYKLGWTLNYEMMFYVVFALAIMLPAARAIACVTAFFVALVLAGMVLKPAPGALSFWTSPMILEFVLGMWIGLGWLRGLRVSKPAGIVLVVAGLGLIAANGSIATDLDRLLNWGFPAALIIAGAALGSQNMQQTSPSTAIQLSLPLRALVAMGDASYALYLCHPFAIRLFRLIWEKAGLASAFGSGAAGAWAYIAVATIAAIAAAVPIYRLFEKPVTQLVQARLGVGSGR